MAEAMACHFEINLLKDGVFCVGDALILLLSWVTHSGACHVEDIQATLWRDPVVKNFQPIAI